MTARLPASARAVQEALDEAGVDLRVVELPDSTRTAREAAAAIGCEVAQIAKSIVFRTTGSQRPVLVVASGPNRIREATVEALVGEPIEQAPPAFVREVTGFAIGGVPPFGHPRPIMTFLDEELLRQPEIWAAAGTPRSVVRLTPDDLRQLTGGPAIAVG